MRSILFALAFIIKVGYGQVSTGHITNYGPNAIHVEAVVSATIDDQGVLFFATEKGVLAYDGDVWHTISLPNEVGAKSVEYDALRKRLWVGGYNTFGYLLRDRDKRYRYVSLSVGAKPTTPFKQVWQIVCGQKHVTFQTNEGLFLVKNDSAIFQPITDTYIFQVEGIEYFSKQKGPLSIREQGVLRPIWNTPETGLGYIVYDVLKLDDTQHLLFTPFDGVYVHHLPTHKVTPYNAPLFQVVKKNTFYSLIKLTDTLIAIGTWDHGILITDLTGRVMDHITVEQGLLSAGVSDFAIDPFGKLWTGTDYGVSVIDLHTAWPAVSVKKQIPQTLITSLQINNEPELYWPNLDTSIVFHRRPEHIRIKFATPGSAYGIINPNRVRLMGFDTTWNSSDYDNFKDYHQLSNGTYTFEIKPSTDYKGSDTASLNFTVNEPWYTFLLDWSAEITIGLAIVFFLIFGTTYRLRASKKELTKLVAEKTLEIESHQQELLIINQNLKETNEELDTFLYRSSHDLIAPLKSIKGLLNLMRLSKEDYEKYIHLMEDRVLRLEKILKEINTYVKNVKSNSATSRFDLEDSVKEAWSSLEFIEGGDKIKCSIDVEKGLELDCERERWDMVINNLFANSIKYHDAGKLNQYIKFVARREKEIVRMVVEDNGQGIRQEHLDRLFEMFYRANENSNGTGLGLFLVKKNVNRLNGSIRIESVFSQGTKIEIILPAY